MLLEKSANTTRSRWMLPPRRSIDGQIAGLTARLAVSAFKCNYATTSTIPLTPWKRSGYNLYTQWTLDAMLPVFETRIIKQMESEEALLGSQKHEEPTSCSKRSSRAWYLITSLNMILFFSSVGVLAANAYRPMNEHLRDTAVYSPILDEVNVKIERQMINSSLFGEIPSPWRGLPNDPETEAAWDQFEHIRTLPLTASQIRRMGKDPSQVARFEDAIWHMGDDAYVGALDFFHQVHCLNLMRKAAFYNHPSSQVTKQHPQGKLYWVHLQHCTDMLMQHLLCTADTGMITYQWQQDNEYPFPDFSVNRQCRDWRQLAEYRDTRAVDLEKYKTYTKPSWLVELPKPKEYWNLLKELNESGEQPGHRHDHSDAVKARI